MPAAVLQRSTTCADGLYLSGAALQIVDMIGRALAKHALWADILVCPQKKLNVSGEATPTACTQRMKENFEWISTKGIHHFFFIWSSRDIEKKCVGATARLRPKTDQRITSRVWTYDEHGCTAACHGLPFSADGHSCSVPPTERHPEGMQSQVRDQGPRPDQQQWAWMQGEKVEYDSSLPQIRGCWSDCGFCPDGWTWTIQEPSSNSSSATFPKDCGFVNLYQ
jgi:hypothetical protein